MNIKPKKWRPPEMKDIEQRLRARQERIDQLRARQSEGVLNAPRHTEDAMTASQLKERMIEEQRKIANAMTQSKPTGVFEEKQQLPRMVEDYNELKADHVRIMNLIGEVIYEAQEHPERLLAFNSPLLNLLIMEYYRDKHNVFSDADQEAYNKYRAVVDARNAA